MLAAEGPAGTSEETGATYQARFLLGVEALHAGNPMRAAAIFEPLLAETGSPRVKLELARALYLLQDYERSEQLFREVLARPDLPWRVGENIRVYLDEIDMATGVIKFSVGVVSDSNPRNFTNSREVMIGGQTLAVVPPEDNRQVTGVRLSVRGYRPLDKRRQTTAFFTAAYADFPGATFDRLSGDVGLAQAVPGLSWLKAKAGFEGARLDGRTLYRFPYVGALAAMAPSDGYRLLGELKLGRLQVPQMPHLDSNNLFLVGKLIPAGAWPRLQQRGHAGTGGRQRSGLFLPRRQPRRHGGLAVRHLGYAFHPVWFCRRSQVRRRRPAFRQPASGHALHGKPGPAAAFAAHPRLSTADRHRL
ncbi:MAG TPA: tetratricopeptide repeat protein [Thiobacillus sp.]|nr:tetratricopeptide repeat protein [Thiobacillus sp.]